MNYPKLTGALQALGLAIIITVLAFLADATNLSFLNNPYMATVVAGICLAIENALQAKTGKALFGSVRL